MRVKMKHAIPELAALAGAAGEALRTLLTDPATPPCVRLQAAHLVLRTCDPDRDDVELLPLPVSDPRPESKPIRKLYAMPRRAKIIPWPTPPPLPTAA